MPRGKYVNHKGRGRSFTSAEELARENKDIENKKWRKKKAADAGEESEDSEDEEVIAAAAAGGEKKEDEEDSDEEETDSDEDDENKKAKGVEGLLSGMIENPNRRVMKVKKISKLDEPVGGHQPAAAASASSKVKESGDEGKPELSRREREAIEKQKAKAHYQKLHAEGKTEEARKDLARLAIIRKQREDAALKRQQDQQDKDAVKQTKQQEIGKALGKK